MFDFCGISRLFTSRRHSTAISTTPSTTTKRSSALSASVSDKQDDAVRVSAPRAINTASSIYSCATIDKPQARAAGQAPSRARATPAPSVAHSRHTSMQSHTTAESASENVRTSQTVRPARGQGRARALPLPVAVRTEQASGVQQYAAYMPCAHGTTYKDHIVIDGERYGRMGSEVLRDALNDDDMLSFADVSAALEHAPDRAKTEALRQKAQRLLRNRAYDVIRHDFPEEFANQTFSDNGVVTLYVPHAQRERSRSRDRRRQKYFIKLAIPPVPPLPAGAAPQERGRAMRARCATPAFCSAPGVADDLQ